MRQYCRLFLTRVEAIQCELMCIMHHCVCSTSYGHVVHRNSHVCMCTPVGFRSSNAHTNVQLQNRTVDTLAYTKILFFKVFSVRFVRSYLWGKGVRGWKKIVLRYTSPICVCLNERFSIAFRAKFECVLALVFMTMLYGFRDAFWLKIQLSCELKWHQLTYAIYLFWMLTVGCI